MESPEVDSSLLENCKCPHSSFHLTLNMPYGIQVRHSDTRYCRFDAPRPHQLVGRVVTPLFPTDWMQNGCSRPFKSAPERSAFRSGANLALGQLTNTRGEDHGRNPQLPAFE